MDLDRAIVMVRDKTRERHKALSEDDLNAQPFELLIQAPSKVAGVMRWLDAS
jgi:hypothetical protein